MGLIHIELFATLDLVGQAPGGPDEDPEGFPFGGWQAPLIDEVSGAQVARRVRGHGRPAARPADVRHLRRLLAAPGGRRGRRHRHALQPHPEVRRLPRHARPLLGRVHPARAGPGRRGARDPRPARARQGRRQPGPGADPAAREALRPARPLGAPDRARRRARRCSTGGAVPTNLTLLEPPVGQPEGHRATCATGSPRARPDGRHERAGPGLAERPDPATRARARGGWPALVIRQTVRQDIGRRSPPSSRSPSR